MDRKRIRFKCDDPDCTSYAYKDLLVGKRAQCKCGREFILSRIELKKKLPQCEYCSNSKESKRKRDIAEAIADIQKDVA